MLFARCLKTILEHFLFLAVYSSVKQNKHLIEIGNLRSQVSLLEIALSDACHSQTQWFGARPYRIGISRPTGAAGGIAVVLCHGVASAHYWDHFYASEMAHISACITGEDSECNRELSKRRATLETAAKWVREQLATT